MLILEHKKCRILWKPLISTGLSAIFTDLKPVEKLYKVTKYLVKIMIVVMMMRDVGWNLYLNIHYTWIFQSVASDIKKAWSLYKQCQKYIFESVGYR